MHILVVEDDAALARELCDRLRDEAFAVDSAADGVEAEYRGAEGVYDAVVLDLGLPEKPGLDVLRAWRARGIDVPVLVLTARDAWYEKVEGFEAGADDYLGKPFHVEELVARLKALLRRSHGDHAHTLSVAGLTLDEDSQAVSDATGRTIRLTGTEFRLLRYFMHNPRRVLSKSQLAEHIYAFDDERDSNVIEVYVTRLRRKLGRDRIRTRRGQGYVFGEDGA